MRCRIDFVLCGRLLKCFNRPAKHPAARKAAELGSLSSALPADLKGRSCMAQHCPRDGPAIAPVGLALPFLACFRRRYGRARDTTAASPRAAVAAAM